MSHLNYKKAAGYLLCGLISLGVANSIAKSPNPPDPNEGLEIQQGHTGVYYEPQYSGQGVQVHVVNRENGKKQVYAYVFTYTYDRDENGNIQYPADTSPPKTKKTWYTLNGEIDDGEDVAVLDIYAPENGLPFVPSEEQPVDNGEPVGTAYLAFSTCKEGLISFDAPDVEALDANEYVLSRLSEVPKLNGLEICDDDSMEMVQSVLKNTPMSGWKADATDSGDFSYETVLNDSAIQQILDRLSIENASLPIEITNADAKAAGVDMKKQSSPKSVDTGANGAPIIGEGHTGSYYDPKYSGQGIEIFNIDRGEVLQSVGFLYTYKQKTDDEGNVLMGKDEGVTSERTWYILDGYLDTERNVLVYDLLTAEGGMAFVPSDERPVDLIKIGEAEVTLNNCSSGKLELTSDDPSLDGKSFDNLQRLDPIIEIDGERLCEDTCRDVMPSPTPPWCSSGSAI